MDANARMPGDAEAAGAIAGMVDTYGRPPAEHAIGDYLWFRDVGGGRSRPARVELIGDNGRLAVRDDLGFVHVISQTQIARA